MAADVDAPVPMSNGLMKLVGNILELLLPRLRICITSAPSCINFGTSSEDEGKTAGTGRSNSLCGLWTDRENT